MKLSGRVSIPFDRDATYTPVGEACDMFSREVRIYVNGHFAFDKYSYKNFTPAEKNAMHEHLSVNVLFKYIYMFCVHVLFLLRLTNFFCLLCSDASILKRLSKTLNVHT